MSAAPLIPEEERVRHVLEDLDDNVLMHKILLFKQLDGESCLIGLPFDGTIIGQVMQEELERRELVEAFAKFEKDSKKCQIL